MKSKLYKVLGVALSIVLVFTTAFCLPAIAEDTTDQAITKDYYVQSIGWEALEADKYDASVGAGDAEYPIGSKENPAPTVGALIAIINDDTEMTANDTANVYILQRSDWNVYDGSVIGNDGTNTYAPYHSMTSWVHATAHNESDAMETHSWKMVVKADPSLTNANSGKIYLAFCDKLAGNISLVANGPTLFENVELVSPRKDYMSVIPNGNDVVFSADTKHGYLNNIEYTASTSSNVTWKGEVKDCNYSRFQLYTGAIGDTDGVNVEFYQPYSITNHFYVTGAGARSKNATVDGDINFIFNNKDISISRMIWGSSKKDTVHTFSNVNINIKAAKNLVNVIDTSYANGTIAVTGGLQVIKPQGFTYNIEDVINQVDDTSNKYGLTVPTDENGELKYWSIERVSEDSDAISFVTDANGKAVLGKYKIREGYTATAFDENGKTYESKDGVLDLSKVPGNYSVTFKKEPITKEYYVQSPGREFIENSGYNASLGTGDQSKPVGSKENPAPTVAALIAIINDDPEMTAGDIANIYILQRSDWNKYDGSVIGNDATVTPTFYNTPYHNMTSWAHATDRNMSIETVEKHSWKMVIKADPSLTNANNGKIYLTFNDRIGAGSNIVATGPVDFEDVVLVSTRQDYMSIIPNGNDVVFSAETTHGALANMDYSKSVTENRTWNGTVASRDFNRFQLYTDAITDTDGVNVTFNQPYKISKYFYITGNDKNNYNIDGDINLIFNNKDINLTGFYWGSGSTKYTHTFNSLNINVKTAAVLDLNDKDNTTGTVAFKNGAQIILDSDTQFSGDLTDVADISIPTNDAGVKKYWCIERVSDDGDAISFVTDASGKAILGKYKISENYTAIATDESGKTYESKEGLLDLSAAPGAYTVTFKRGAIKKDYYVRSPGWEDLDDGVWDKGLGTKESPAATVKDVVDIINADGLVAGDTANVYIMNHSDVGDSESLKYDGSVIGCDKSTGSNVFYIPYHSFTSWQHTDKNVSTGGSAPAEHTFNLVIKADPEATETVYLAYADTIGNGALHLSGPTVFDDVTVLSPRGIWNSVIANGNDLTYSKNCKFAGIPMDYSKSYSAGVTWNGEIENNYGALNTYLLSNTKNLTFDGINVNIDAKYSSDKQRSLYMARGVNATFTGDYNLTIDNAGAKPWYLWGTTAASTTLALTNLNIYVKKGQLVNKLGSEEATSVMTANAVQVIEENNASVTDLETVLTAKNITNYYHIKNGGEEGMISFHRDNNGNAIAGTFDIAEGYEAIAVNNSTAEEVESINGVLTLTGKPGKYTLVFKEAKSDKYSSYINVRNGLGNTFSKLKNDKELNVVYFGGSVTSGTGSSNNELYSWRARIGNWLTNNFPAANVNNIKQSIGETGTYLGCYRVARDIVSNPKAPDLLFIEYSINDFYDHASYDRAQMQFETVVREVKTAYPDCDIVTILVTDYSCVSEARKGNLHTQAQAHEDICIKYNIPSIHVGKALGAALGTSWVKQSNYENDPIWCEYVDDTVHPTDAGYEIYFNVIKEFFNNELNYGNYDGNIAINPMPQIQNKYKYLFDGDITYIDESTVEFTTEGGSSYDPNATGIVSKEDYQGLIYIPAGSTDTVTVNFTGTELIMVTTGGHSKLYTVPDSDTTFTEADDVDSKTAGIQVYNTFEYSLDGGETWTTGNYLGKNPTVITAGLDAGEHTAIIRPSSYEQTRIAGFYSRDVEKSSNILNIADLVNAAEQIAASTTEAYFDYNNDDVINERDVATVRKILLNNK